MVDEPRGIDDLLMAERPAPRAAFRGFLRRHLLAIGAPPARPRNLGVLVLGFGACGLLLLSVAALSVAGLGPLGS